MEILIPGLLLVGFMVWASTRIKRNASKAFDREEIETPEFSLVKPEGLLSMVDPPEGRLFQAYSKEFGSNGAEQVRKATAVVNRYADAHFDDVVERVKVDSTAIISEQTGIIDGRKCANILVERLDQGITLESHHKIIATPEAVYQLSVTVLPDHKDAFQRGIDEMLNSFSLT